MNGSAVTGIFVFLWPTLAAILLASDCCRDGRASTLGALRLLFSSRILFVLAVCPPSRVDIEFPSSFDANDKFMEGEGDLIVFI